MNYWLAARLLDLSIFCSFLCHVVSCIATGNTAPLLKIVSLCTFCAGLHASTWIRYILTPSIRNYIPSLTTSNKKNKINENKKNCHSLKLFQFHSWQKCFSWSRNSTNYSRLAKQGFGWIANLKNPTVFKNPAECILIGTSNVLKMAEHGKYSLIAGEKVQVPAHVAQAGWHCSHTRLCPL